ncbi:MAG: hypothetical protein CMJ20_06200 [Phycisphaeraceae bacterium]|nr:hypothetical protein [Phycisphaeraceae bacterium]|tara:strand:- start:2010 stop:3761 length:1752 start_codon:yes stop_codon:yes gene_type:complete
MAGYLKKEKGNNKMERLSSRWEYRWAGFEGQVYKRQVLLFVLLLVFFFEVIAWSDQAPILLTFDLHVDPVNNGFPAAGKAGAFQERTEWMQWVLDQTEPYAIPMSFLSGGWYMERVVSEEPPGGGAVLVRRMYETGGQIGSHHHKEFRASSFNWPSMESDASLPEVRKQWEDNINWVDAGIQKALELDPPVTADINGINRIKGAHSPQDESDYHQLMTEFGFDVREPGPEEDYYGYFGHHIWHPYRPSAANYLGEDLSASFVQVPSGPVIGYETIHHGTLQDMRPASMKRQLLQIYLNWRHANHADAGSKVWTWGWGSHATDFEPSSVSRAALVEMLPWIENHFRNRIEPNGASVLQYATHLDVADAYLSWETENPGVSSFTFDSLIVEDWTTYPWLQPVAKEMQDYLWHSDLDMAGVSAFKLERDGSDAVLLYNDGMTPVAVDLEFIFPGRIQVIGLQSGAVLSGTTGVLPDELLVMDEPLWVTAIDLLLGDANGDGVIDVADLGILGANYGMTDVIFPDGDFNGDGVVDIADLGVLGAYWSSSSLSDVLGMQDTEQNVSIPEPAILSLFTISMLVIASRRH